MDNFEAKLKEGFDAVEKSLSAKVEQYEGQLKESGEVMNSVREEVKSLSEQHAELNAEINGFKGELNDLMQKGAGGILKETPKSLGQQFVESDQFAQLASGNIAKAKVTFQNNTIIGESGSPQTPDDAIVAKDYMPGIIGGAFRQLTLLDAVNKGMTSSNTVHYTRENTFTNSAAETAEAGSKPESTLTFTGVDEPVRTIAHFLKASKQILDDAPFLSSYIDRRLGYGVSLRVEQQIYAGNGTGSNLSGISTTGNHTDLTLVTADNRFDATNRAKYQVIASDYVPSAYLINPADWGAMERTKTGISSDNSYLAGGDAAISYIAGGMQPMLWGLPVIVSNSVTSGTFACVSRDALMYVERQGVTVEMFEQDDTNVQSNLVTIRAECRGALAIFRPAAVIYGAMPSS